MGASYNFMPSHQGNHLHMTRNQRLIVLAGVAISVIFLWLAFRGLKPETVWSYIQQASIAPLLLGAVWYFTAVSLISLRWQFLLRSVRFVPFKRLFPLVCIGYMGNNVYPLRSGEILRVLLLQRQNGVPIARATVVSIAERVFDGLVMLTFVFVALALLNVASPSLRSIADATAPLFLIALVVFFVLAARPNVLRRIVEVVSRVFPGRLRALALHLGDEVLAGLEGFRTPADLIGTIVCSYLSWMLEASVYWIVSFAFNLQIDYATALLVVGVVNLAGLLPASPGQLGVFEFFVVTVLGIVGIAEGQATAYALVVHLVIWLPVTLVGFIFMARFGLGWDSVTRARELENKAVAQ
jgi:uncharacterized protein (TIRG00374 family)